MVIVDERRPAVDLTKGMSNIFKTKKTNKIDITAETVTPIFQRMKIRFERTHEEQQEYQYHKLNTKENHQILLTYKVMANKNGKLNYKVVVKANNDNAKKGEPRVHR